MITNCNSESVFPGNLKDGIAGTRMAKIEPSTADLGASPVPGLKKEKHMSMMHCSLLSLGCAFGFAAPNQQSSLTALRALKIAQRRLRPEVRSKLLSVSSHRTDGSLTPEAWRFVFLDPATSGNCRVVTVASKTSSEHPDTVEAFSSIKTEAPVPSHPIVQSKWVIDSDKAIAAARVAAKLKGIRAAEFRLGQTRNGQEATWTLYFYAEGAEPVVHFEIGAKLGTVKIVAKNESAAASSKSVPRELVRS
jgi:hypothetical protein